MHNLGQTRSSHQRNHLLLTPDTFVRTTLPGMKNASAVVHVGPALGAAFTQVVNYWLGSSKGSSDKTDLLAATNPTIGAK